MRFFSSDVLSNFVKEVTARNTNATALACAESASVIDSMLKAAAKVKRERNREGREQNTTAIKVSTNETSIATLVNLGKKKLLNSITEQ